MIHRAGFESDSLAFPLRARCEAVELSGAEAILAEAIHPNEEDVTSMLGNLQGWHLIVILAVVLLLFGAPKLPGLARSIGQSMRIFRSEVKTMKDENGNVVVVEDDEDADEAPAAKVTTAKNTAAKVSTAQSSPKSSTTKPKS